MRVGYAVSFVAVAVIAGAIGVVAAPEITARLNAAPAQTQSPVRPPARIEGHPNFSGI